MCGLPLWVIQGLVTGLCSCGLAIPLLFVKGNDAMVFLIVAATSLSLVSMLTSYYLFGRFMNGLSEELQRMRSPDDIPLSLRHMAHHLTPLCRVREAKVLMKHLEATLSRIHARCINSESVSPKELDRIDLNGPNLNLFSNGPRSREATNNAGKSPVPVVVPYAPNPIPARRASGHPVPGNDHSKPGNDQ